MMYKEITEAMVKTRRRRPQSPDVPSEDVGCRRRYNQIPSSGVHFTGWETSTMPSPASLSPSMNLYLADEIARSTLSVEQLVRDCLTLDNCVQIPNGAVVAYSGKYTGRTPKDKHIVREPSSEDRIWWEGNNALSPEVFASIRESLCEYTRGKRLYVIDTFAGADPAHRIRARFILERAYHALFIKQLLIRPTEAELASYSPDWTIIDMGKRLMDPELDGTKGEAVIALSFAEKQVLIAGTEYAGEIKKSVFTIMNYLLPVSGGHEHALLGQHRGRLGIPRYFLDSA